MDILTIIQNQRNFYKTNQTLEYSFRKENLSRLRFAIISNQKKIETALLKDLGKSNAESYMTEIGFVLKELSYMEKNLKKLMKPKRVKSNLTDYPSKSFRYAHPYGNTLIISPWNYPINLTFGPLIGAIAAGNTAIIKPSEFSVNTSNIIAEIIKETFPSEYISVVLGGIETNQQLLDQKFDYIFFTGSTNVGKIVMEKASKHLTPISLELGGKSPVIVDCTANIKVSAKRIAFGKFLNAGQTCIAPDYMYIHKDIKKEFLVALKEAIKKFYGDNPMESPNFGSIINRKHYQRIKNYIKDGKIYYGGETNDETLRISPTILENTSLDSPVMLEEIFGPILPVIEYDNIDEVILAINNNPSPLALYIFTENKNTEAKIIRQCQFGGGCVNDTVVHIASEFLPFGGVGESGMGSYHGANTFKTFTHYKSILKKATWFDLPIRYAPYSDKNIHIVKKFLK